MTRPVSTPHAGTALDDLRPTTYEPLGTPQTWDIILVLFGIPDEKRMLMSTLSILSYGSALT